MEKHSSAAIRLKKLEARAAKEIELLNYPPRKNWLPEKRTTDGKLIYDVVVVGGGQTGIALLFSLLREKVSNIVAFDECDEGYEGPWRTYARMDTLRTPKYTTGPDCNIPSLTFQAWYEAQYGEKGWESIDFIPRLEWASYLQWLRNFLKLPIENRAKVGAIRWLESEKCFVVPVTSSSFKEVYSRKIILATGLQGSGEWTVPEHVLKNIPHDYYDQTSEDIDFKKVKGKKIGILGGGPCAFDNALQCCKYGAQEVHIFLKKPKLVNLHVYLWGEFSGFLKNFPALPDHEKWRLIAKMIEIGQPPTPSGVAALRAQKNITMHFSSPWLDSKMVNGFPTVITPDSEIAFDRLMIAIGWIVDLNKRNELEEFHDKIALWSDKFTPPKDQECLPLLNSPYLGKGSNFTEKVPGTAPYLSSIFNCTGGALLSTGFNAGTGLTGMKYSIQSVVQEVTNQLFSEDSDYFYHTLETYHDYIFEN